MGKSTFGIYLKVKLELKDDAKQEVLPPARRLDGHTNGITHLQTLPDGKTLVSSSLDHTIRVWGYLGRRQRQ